MDMSNPLTVVGIVLTAFIVLMVLSVVLEFLSHPIRFLAKIVLKIAGILFVILAMFQIADLINNKGVKWDAVAVMVGCALVGALCEWLIVRPSMLERAPWNERPSREGRTPSMRNGSGIRMSGTTGNGSATARYGKTETRNEMNEKNAAPEPGERSCLSRTGVILEIEEREYRRRINRRSEL